MMDRDNYNKIFDNGVAHIEAARTLAATGQYGFAVSHIILGLEELIKYQVVTTHAVDDTIFDEANPERGKSIFNDHLTKHNLLEEFQLSISEGIADKWIASIVNEMTGKPLSPEQMAIKANRFRQMGSFLSTSCQEINIPQADRQAFFDWLKEANTTKNRGLYVNLTGNISKSPKDFSREDYETALKYANAILKQTEIMKSLDLTDDEFIDMMNSEANIDPQNNFF